MLEPKKHMLGISIAWLMAGGTRRSGFFYRHRFAGQRGLVEEEVLGGQHAHVGGHHIAGGEQDDIARHQLAQRYFPPFALAQHGGGGLDHRLQVLGGLVGAHFLVEAQHEAQHHHQTNDDRGAQVGCQIRDNRQH
jgi:hypothetical protein